jgi:folate-dependent phosphoribosylglycinamide formyltransferase PurN
LYSVVGVIASKQCQGLKFAKQSQIPCKIFDFKNKDVHSEIGAWLQKHGADIVVLAGFIQKWPTELLKDKPVLNIHPALLPKFGGKGMYGMNVHRAVKDNQEKESGATVHLVSENYDEGPILAQSKVKIEDNDTPERIASKVFQAECNLYPKAIEAFVRGGLVDGEVLFI